jgi:hypothetical protein
MAGFPPALQDTFYRPRSLEQAVWPLVDEWLTCFNSASAAEDEGKLHKADDEEGPIATISQARDFCVYFSNSASF